MVPEGVNSGRGVYCFCFGMTSACKHFLALYTACPVIRSCTGESPDYPADCERRNEFKALDDIILTRIASKVGLAEEISAYLVNAGGKRVRPLLTLLALKALGKEDERGTLLAASIEFLHTATLLHDDVVDESEQRRGRDTANQVWGNAHWRATLSTPGPFNSMVDVGDMQILKELADTTNTIAEGELQQLINKGDVDVDETAYFDVIYAKTARLFEAAGRVAGLLANDNDTQTQGLAEYGRLIGLAFQIADDALDYQRDANSGKSLGDDLAEGKITLPILIARDALPADQARWLDMQFTRANGDALDEVIEKLEATQALERTLERAENLADQAIAELAPLPESEFKAHLVTLAHIAARRNSSVHLPSARSDPDNCNCRGVWIWHWPPLAPAVLGRRINLFEITGCDRDVGRLHGCQHGDPTYKAVCTDTTGHAEVVQIEYDLSD